MSKSQAGIELQDKTGDRIINECTLYNNGGKIAYKIDHEDKLHAFSADYLSRAGTRYTTHTDTCHF